MPDNELEDDELEQFIVDTIQKKENDELMDELLDDMNYGIGGG